MKKLFHKHVFNLCINGKIKLFYKKRKNVLFRWELEGLWGGPTQLMQDWVGTRGFWNMGSGGYAGL